MEKDYEDGFNTGINLLHPDKWYSVHSALTYALKLTGLYWLGTRNAERIQVRQNHVKLAELPTGFDGFRILHLSDLHVDMNAGRGRPLQRSIAPHNTIFCVFTG